MEREGRIKKWTWTEYGHEADMFTKAMHAVGVEERASVNIMGHNAPEWVIAFMGAV